MTVFHFMDHHPLLTVVLTLIVMFKVVLALIVMFTLVGIAEARGPKR